MKTCPECGGRTYMHESGSYYARWEECDDCGWRGTISIIPAEERV